MKHFHAYFDKDTPHTSYPSPPRLFPSYLLLYFLFIFYLPRCILPDFPHVSSLPFLSLNHRTTIINKTSTNVVELISKHVNFSVLADFGPDFSPRTRHTRKPTTETARPRLNTHQQTSWIYAMPRVYIVLYTCIYDWETNIYMYIYIYAFPKLAYRRRIYINIS